MLKDKRELIIESLSLGRNKNMYVRLIKWFIGIFNDIGEAQYEGGLFVLFSIKDKKSIIINERKDKKSMDRVWAVINVNSLEKKIRVRPYKTYGDRVKMKKFGRDSGIILFSVVKKTGEVMLPVYGVGGYLAEGEVKLGSIYDSKLDKLTVLRRTVYNLENALYVYDYNY